MSVYMDELPTACEYCPCCNYDWARCELTGDRLQNDVENSRADNCKLKLLSDVRENVKGRWVEVVDRTEMYDKEGVKTWGMLFQCNQCGFVLNAIEGHTGQYNYCPNCGAEMGGKS